jgi:hypothetical protein
MAEIVFLADAEAFDRLHPVIRRSARRFDIERRVDGFFQGFARAFLQ